MLKIDPSIFLPEEEVAGPKPARVANSVFIATAAAAAGFGLGFWFGKSRIAGIGGAALAWVARSVEVLALNLSVPEVAAADLLNLVAGFDDPAALRKDNVDVLRNVSEFCLFVWFFIIILNLFILLEKFVNMGFRVLRKYEKYCTFEL